jgi:hypothetical protein
MGLAKKICVTVDPLALKPKVEQQLAIAGYTIVDCDAQPDAHLRFSRLGEWSVSLNLGNSLTSVYRDTYSDESGGNVEKGVVRLLNALARAKSQQEATGVISGKVFLITRGGDLKPARLAMVSLLDAHAGKNAKDSASLFYFNTKLANMKASFRQLADPDDNISCQTSLLVFGNSLKSTLEWNERERKDLIKIGETDEEGAFRFLGVPPGEYLILAQGHAGANRAYWEEEATAETGKEVSIKLSSPKNACLE